MNKVVAVVFCEEHFNPLGIIRSLGENGVNTDVIVLKNDRRVASKSKYINNIHFVKTREEGLGYLKKKYGNRKNEDIFVFTSDDTTQSFLDEDYNELKKLGFIFYNAGKKSRITKFMDKKTINNLAEKHGLKVAKNWVVDPKKMTIPKDIEYPVITKAGISTIDDWKGDVHICENEEELRDALRKVRSKKILLQRYIRKDNELAIEGFSIDKGKKVFYAAGINFNYVLADRYSHYMTLHNFEDKGLIKKLNAMFAEIGFEGIFEVEFLIEGKNKYFLEINFRPSAWNYATTPAGMPLAYLWLDAMRGGTSSDFNRIQKNIPKNFTAMSEPDDFRIRVKSKMINPIKWLFQMLGCNCKYYINWKDMGPFFSIIKHKRDKKKK